MFRSARWEHLLLLRVVTRKERDSIEDTDTSSCAWTLHSSLDTALSSHDAKINIEMDQDGLAGS